MNSTAPIPDPQQPRNLKMFPVSKEPKPKRKWLRIAGWVSGSLLVVFLVLLTVGIAILNSTWFHNYVLTQAQKKASTALGAQVQIQNFNLSLSTLTLDIYGLTIHGAEPYPNPPLLLMSHAKVGVRVVSVFRQKWYLSDLEFDHPTVRVFMDAQGRSNIPKPQKTQTNGKKTDLFDLGIRHAVLRNGEVSYNDKKSSLSADLHDVDFNSSFDPLAEKYSGRLLYTNGKITANNHETFQHGLEANFDATRSTFHLAKSKLTSGQSQFLLDATVQNYDDPTLAATYSATLNGDDLRRILANTSLPAGIVRAAGSVHYHALPNHPSIDGLQLAGTLDSKTLALQTQSARVAIDNLAAQYSVEDGNATLSSLHARAFGGELAATAKLSALTGNTRSEAKATLKGASLALLKGSLKGSPLSRQLNVDGALNTEVNATWGKTLKDLVASVDAGLSGHLAGRSNTGGTVAPIPIDSAIHGEYRADTEQFALNQSYLRLPKSNVTMNGTMSKRSNLMVHFRSDDLREIETVAEIFQSPTEGQPQQPLGLAGTASFDGSLHGPTSAPQLSGQLVMANLHVKGTDWRAIKTDVQLSPSSAALHNGRLQPASQGNIYFDVTAGLRKWAFDKATSPLQVSLDASQLNVAELARLSGSDIPVTGTLNANVKMQGTVLRPVGEGKLALSRSTVYQEPLQTAQLSFSGTGDEVHTTLNISSSAGDLQGNVSVRPQEKSYVAELTSNGLHLERLQSLKAKKLDAVGEIALHAKGQGTFDNPAVDATIQSSHLEIQKQAINALSLQLNVANHLATANLSSQAVNTSVRGSAKIQLTGDYPAEANLDTQAIPLQPLAAIYMPTQAENLNGQTEIHAYLKGPLKNKKLLEAHVRIPVLKVNYSNSIQLAAASPIQADYKDGVISVQRSAIRGTDTDLRFQGSIPTSGNAPMSLLLLGTVNLHLAQLLSPDLRTSGQLRFNINSYGNTGDPNVQGQIQLVDAGFASGDLPVGLQHANGTLTLTKDRLNISKFQGTMGNGELSASGGVLYRPNMQFDIGLSLKGARVLYPQGVRETVNADVRLAGTTENAILGGGVTLADLSFTPAFDLTDFIGQFSGGVAAPPAQGFAQNLQLNLAVNSSNNINLVSRTLSVNGTANLQVKGTAAQPVILGRVNLNGGDLIFHGTRFVLNGGTIQFVNPTQTQPVVNVALSTNIQQYNISLRFNGPVDQLRTNYSSDPSLPAADIINLLAFGQTTEASAANAPTPTNQAAESLVASQVSSQITSRVSKIAGISQLSINPVLSSGTSQGPAGANITIQQRVTGNLFVTFSSNMASTQNQIISGQYQISPRVAVSATRDQNGGFAVDTQIKKTW